MSGESLRVEIEGEPTGRRSADNAEREHIATLNRSADENAARSRQAMAETQQLRNEALIARRQQAEQALQTVDIQAEAATTQLRTALEVGDWENMALRQREVAALEARRAQLQSTADELARARPVPVDPVEAAASAPGRSPEAAAWFRAHPEFVTDARKNAKLTAAHSDAIAEGIAPDTPEYFSHVNRHCGLDDSAPARRNNGGNGAGGNLRVLVGNPKHGERLGPNEIRMTPGEYKAATETLTWNYDSADGKHRRGEPLGVVEYLRRKGVMQKEGGWYDKLES